MHHEINPLSPDVEGAISMACMPMYKPEQGIIIVVSTQVFGESQFNVDPFRPVVTKTFKI